MADKTPAKPTKKSSKSKGSKTLPILLGLLAIAVGFAYVTFLRYVEPNEYGILIRNIGINRGVQEKVLGPGYHLVIPFAEELHRLPREVQILDFTNYPTPIYDKAYTEKAAYIQTSDGFFVDVDVTVIYRIIDPYIVFTSIGPGTLFVENGLLPKAEPILKQALGELTTEEFYESPVRSEKAILAEKLLNEELESKGLQVDHVLIRYFNYSDEIQRNIEEKKLKDQLVFKNQAEANSARAGAKLTKVVEEGRKMVDVKLEEGRAYVAVVEGELENYSRQRRSEADLLVKLAEAKKTEMKNKALRSGGSSQLVGLEMAEVLKGLELVILPSDGKDGVNPLNLRENLQRFEVR